MDEHQWFTRLEAERRAGNISRAECDVLYELGRLLLRGDDMPSEARLANEAMCSRRTVQRAKVRARELGLLQWERRFDNAGGLRRELPCVYRTETPTTPVVKRERQRGTLQRSLLIPRSVQQQLAALPPVTPALMALWEARAAARQAGGGRAGVRA